MIGNPLKVEDIISELGRKSIRLPEIQRGYVWKRPQISKLLDSIYNNYPTGSILLWDTVDSIITKDLDTNIGEDQKPDFAPKIVLDGQQRITSLGNVFDRNTEKPDRVIFNVIDEIFETYSPRYASDPRWLDVTEFMTEGINELDVLDRLGETGVIASTDKATRNLVHDRLKKLSSIRKYQFPVEIVREDDLEIVTEIFIRVNSGGTRLVEAELALARLAWKLPGSIVGWFEETVEDCTTRGFDLDTRFLIRCLVAVSTRQSRFKDLKAFWKQPAEVIEKNWKKTARGLTLALDFVEGNVGIPGSAFLPSHLSLIPLTVIFAERDHLKADEERLLRKWFLTANSFSRYVGATDSKLSADLSALGEKCENITGLWDLLVRDMRGVPTITPTDIERSGTNSPFFPLAYLAIVKRNAKDWFTGIKIRREAFSEDQQIEYHHVFPKKHLNAMGVDRYLRDEIANMAFLGQKANRKILARKPDDYLAEIADHDSKRLEAQFVPMDRSLWNLDRFDDFLAERRKNLVHAMNEILEG